MSTPILLLMTALLLALPAGQTSGAHGVSPTARGVLIEARNLAYDAMYRNDQAGLQAAASAMEPLTKGPDVEAYAHYYLSWTYWSLSGAQVQAQDTGLALESGKAALRHARLAVAARPADPECHAALANALIVVMILDRAQMPALLEELMTVRRKAIELGPKNPRVAMLDAGIMFNNPAEKDGQTRGIDRWREALSLFEAEAAETQADPLAPRWGHATAYGWLASLYLRLTPPRKDEARAVADIALRMRPDFWWVREQVMPRLRE